MATPEFAPMPMDDLTLEEASIFHDLAGISPVKALNAWQRRQMDPNAVGALLLCAARRVNPDVTVEDISRLDYATALHAAADALTAGGRAQRNQAATEAARRQPATPAPSSGPGLLEQARAAGADEQLLAELERLANGGDDDGGDDGGAPPAGVPVRPQPPRPSGSEAARRR